MPVVPRRFMTAAGQSLIPLSSHLTLSGIVIGPTVTVGLQFLAYGFYIMSFTLCLLVLQQRSRTRERTFHLTMIVALFILATLGLVIHTALAIFAAGGYFYERVGGGAGEDHARTLEMMNNLRPAFG
ncbi:hypothetical protein PM082_019697 [Marasmius tenuissimus]|nr:hypothetical protein PM082_019697 [Marasmius tenuissimus]